MCGIAGIFSFKKFKNEQKIKKLAMDLLLNIENRGLHATGISLINSKDDEISIYKKDVCATDFIKIKKFHKFFKNIQDYNILLLHTRQATHGDANKSFNNHPHFNKRFNNVIVHNGIISNYTELKEKYKLKLDGECDSEIILNLFNRKKHDLKSTLKVLSGSMAFALYHKHKLYLYANSNPLNICLNKTRDLFLFSSHYNIFKELFTKKVKQDYDLFDFYKNKEDFSVYKFEDENLLRIFFKSNRIKQDTAEINDYYYSTWNITESKTIKEDIKPLKIINEKQHTQGFLKSELKQKEKELLMGIKLAKKDDLIKNKNIDYEYLTDDDYLQALDDEDNEREQRHKNKIHTQPLNEKILPYGYEDY